MIERPVFLGNWKMNHGPSEARAYMAAFLRIFAPHDDRTIALFPPALSLATVRDARAARTDILLGVQNIHSMEKGAFTGENSAPMARDAGASFVLVGHSERRHVFGESDVDTAKKMEVAERSGLTPVLCVGETLAQRQAGEAERVVREQFEAGVSRLLAGSIRSIMIAYEPVWAIGTGHSATPQDASEMHGCIRSCLRGRIGADADAIPVLYGGSVSRANAKSLLEEEDIDGVLVGGASLEPEGWAEICRT